MPDKLDVRKYDYRHRKCNRLLFRAYLAPGTMIQIRCPKCGGMISFKSTLDKTPRAIILVDTE